MLTLQKVGNFSDKSKYLTKTYKNEKECLEKI